METAEVAGTSVNDRSSGLENKYANGEKQQPKMKLAQEKKPRRKRNRKRPRSEVHSNQHVKIATSIKQLEMDGKAILDQAGNEQFIRVIHPYPYTFSSFAKQRWVGRTILDVYVSEFGSYPEVRTEE